MNFLKRRGIKAAVEFKLEDAWVGAFWKEKRGIMHLWICLLPCLPLHVQWDRHPKTRDIEDIPF